MPRRALPLALIALLVLGSRVPAWAQGFDPRQALAAVIVQLQTGQPNPGWYGQQLWMTMAFQTGSTGVYPVLVQAGPVTDVQVTQQQPLPNGILFQLVSTHQTGLRLAWTMGISTLTNRIELLNFGPAQSAPPLPAPTPLPAPSPRIAPAPTPSPPPTPGGGGNPTPTTSDEACRRFPNLC